MRAIDNTTQAHWRVFPWPEWVPDSVRVHIEHLWDTPLAWSRDSVAAGGPIFGTAVHLDLGDGAMVTGNYVHIMGRLGRVVSRTTPSVVHVVALHRGQPRLMPKLGARP